MLHLHRHCPPIDRIPSRSTYPSEQQETVEGNRRLIVEQQTMKVTTAEWRILGVAYPVTVNNRRHNMPGCVELLPGGQHTIRLEDEGFLGARTRSSGHLRPYTADVNDRL